MEDQKAMAGRGTGRDMLVVDDRAGMRMMIVRTLRQAGFDGHDIEQAQDGDKALEIIRGCAPNLVLADWNMPNMTGIELLEAVAFGPEVKQVFSGLVVFENVVTRVAIGQEDITMGADCDRRGIEFLNVESRFLGKPQSQNAIPASVVPLDSLGVVVAGRVNEFAPIFLADLHVVDI